ncbi:MAG: hypothetical protein LBS60_08790 [Deltaproteobacteria bacterium]|jgi:hypothetical protein|nr:hypothetical protein [Deltaproteobacteria bacterium]
MTVNLPVSGYNPPANVLQILNDTVGLRMDSLGRGLASIGFRNNRFHLKENGLDTTLTNPDGSDATTLDFVLLNMAPKFHNIWFDTPFNPATVGTVIKPTAIWWENDPLPAHVPQWVMTTKTDKNTKHYQVKQRLVVSPLTLVGEQIRYDLSKIYIMDIASQSIFGDNEGTAMSFVNLIRFCKSHGCLPMTFPIRAVFRRNVTTPSLRFIPFMDGNAKPAFFSPQTQEIIFRYATAPDVIRLLDVINLQSLEENTSEPEGGAPQSTPQPAPAYQPPPQPAPVYQQPAPQPAPVYQQPAPQPAPAYQPPPQPAPAYQPPPQPAPVYQQPAPQPAPAYQQPAPQPAPINPAYQQPAPQPAYQPAPQPAYQPEPAYQPPVQGPTLVQAPEAPASVDVAKAKEIAAKGRRAAAKAATQNEAPSPSSTVDDLKAQVNNILNS